MDSSSAQHLLSRRARSLLSLAGKLFQLKTVPKVAQKLQTRKHKQAVNYDRGAKELHPLETGDAVRVLPLPGQSKWFKARVEDQVAVRSYTTLHDPVRTVRNHSHLYKVPEKYQAISDDEAVQS